MIVHDGLKEVRNLSFKASEVTLRISKMEVKILTKISRKISSYHTIDMERESCRSKGSHPVLVEATAKLVS